MFDQLTPCELMLQSPALPMESPKFDRSGVAQL